MNSEQRIEAVLELLDGQVTAAQLSARLGVDEAELLAWRDTWLAGVRAGRTTRAPRRSFRVLGAFVATALVGLVSREAYAASCAAPSLFNSLGLKYFCADDPALADEVNQNTAQLVGLIQQKVGAGWGSPDAGASTVGITTPTANVSTAANFTGAATANFGNSTRQMLNLWGTSFGIGIQDNTLYFRSGNNFAWYVGGAHNDAELNAGGGTEVMRITPPGVVSVRGRKQTDFAIANNRYEVQRFIVETSPSWNGYAVQIDPTALDALCRDDDGCPFTLSMVNFSNDGNVATREGTLFLSQTSAAWRAVFSQTDIIGVDGSGGVSEMSAWDCYFGDSEATDFNNNRSDTSPGFSLLNAKGGNYSDTTTSCRLVFRD